MIWITRMNLENVFQRPLGKVNRISLLMLISTACHYLWKPSCYNSIAQFQPWTWSTPNPKVGFSNWDKNHCMLPWWSYTTISLIDLVVNLKCLPLLGCFSFCSEYLKIVFSLVFAAGLRKLHRPEGRWVKEVDLWKR